MCAVRLFEIKAINHGGKEYSVYVNPAAINAITEVPAYNRTVVNANGLSAIWTEESAYTLVKRLDHFGQGVTVSPFWEAEEDDEIPF